MLNLDSTNIIELIEVKYGVWVFGGNFGNDTIWFKWFNLGFRYINYFIRNIKGHKITSYNLENAVNHENETLANNINQFRNLGKYLNKMRVKPRGWSRFILINA